MILLAQVRRCGSGDSNHRNQASRRGANAYSPKAAWIAISTLTSAPPLQGVYLTLYFQTYIISPKHCHAFVG